MNSLIIRKCATDACPFINPSMCKGEYKCLICDAAQQQLLCMMTKNMKMLMLLLMMKINTMTMTMMIMMTMSVYSARKTIQFWGKNTFNKQLLLISYFFWNWSFTWRTQRNKVQRNSEII